MIYNTTWLSCARSRQPVIPNFMLYIFWFIINYFKQSRQYHTESNKYENQIINIRKRAACYKSKRVLHLTQLHSSSTHSSSLILLYPAPLNHFSPNHSLRRQLSHSSADRVLTREHHILLSFKSLAVPIKRLWSPQFNTLSLLPAFCPLDRSFPCLVASWNSYQQNNNDTSILIHP